MEGEELPQPIEENPRFLKFWQECGAHGKKQEVNVYDFLYSLSLNREVEEAFRCTKTDIQHFRSQLYSHSLNFNRQLSHSLLSGRDGQEGDLAIEENADLQENINNKLFNKWHAAQLWGMCSYELGASEERIRSRLFFELLPMHLTGVMLRNDYKSVGTAYAQFVHEHPGHSNIPKARPSEAQDSVGPNHTVNVTATMPLICDEVEHSYM